MSDTPRADKERAALIDVGCDFTYPAQRMMTLARQLERELADEKETSEMLASDLRAMNASCQEMHERMKQSHGPRDCVAVSRSLAERTEAMFRSVDPEGSIAQEWKASLSATPNRHSE